MVSTLIINKCQKNDRVSQMHLYNACAPYVFAIVRSYIADEEYIKDVMQDSFASIFKSIATYDESKGQFKSWISQISSRKCIDHLKSTNKISFNSQLEVVKELSEDQFNHLDQLSREDIHELLKDMPSGYRSIFLLKVIDDYSHKEIADFLDISAETSRSQLHRAINWIKTNIINTSNQYRYEAL